jgi:hypothetical protein
MAPDCVLGSENILYVPKRVRLRCLLACGLVGYHFEHPRCKAL